jgi:hypothetical protein
VSIFMMLHSSRRARAGVLAVAGLGTMLGTWSAPALAAGPFRLFLGSWQGSGAITTQDGRREPISCRATYDAGEGDESLTQSLVCASDAFRVNIEASLTAQGGQVQGEWRETSRGAQGAVTGQIGSGDFEGTVSGPGFTVQLSIRSNGRRQVVHIAPSAGDIRSVDLSLSKRR